MDENETVPAYPVARFDQASRTSTVTEAGWPLGIGLAMPLTTSCAAAPGATEMPDCAADLVPSLTEIDCCPTVLSAIAKPREPASAVVKVVAGGRAACASEDENDTVPT